MIPSLKFATKNKKMPSLNTASAVEYLRIYITALLKIGCLQTSNCTTRSRKKTSQHHLNYNLTPSWIREWALASRSPKRKTRRSNLQLISSSALKSYFVRTIKISKLSTATLSMATSTARSACQNIRDKMIKYFLRFAMISKKLSLSWKLTIT